MKRKMSILTAFTVAFLSLGAFYSSQSNAKVLEPDYEQGGFAEDDNGVCVYVCPHSIAESNCVR